MLDAPRFGNREIINNKVGLFEPDPESGIHTCSEHLCRCVPPRARHPRRSWDRYTPEADSANRQCIAKFFGATGHELGRDLDTIDMLDVLSISSVVRPRRRVIS